MPQKQKQGTALRCPIKYYCNKLKLIEQKHITNFYI